MSYSLRYHRVRLPEADVKALPGALRGLLVLGSLFADEINVLQNLMNSSIAREKMKPPLALFSAQQANLLLRILILKQLEFDKAIHAFRQKEDARKEPFATMFSECAHELRSIRKGRAYKIAQMLRDKMIGHLDLEHAIKAGDEIAMNGEYEFFL